MVEIPTGDRALLTSQYWPWITPENPMMLVLYKQHQPFYKGYCVVFSLLLSNESVIP
ncbi:MAG: hypothetical protein ACI8R9_000605 [Paraglaciecola sp.]|jgi:hypothetical protein